MNVDLTQGEKIVEYARSVIEQSFAAAKPAVPEGIEKILKQKRGVFVTLSRYPSHELRGCIGYPEPVLSLGDAVEKSALSAAFDDPRFPSVVKEEMDGLTVEVSILTPPQIIEVNDPQQYLKKIRVGRDGLIVESGFHRGLLLPQVPMEWKWNEEEFLAHTCMKAGLPPDMWLDASTKLYSFTAQIYAESEPRGKIVEKPLSE